MSKRLGFVSVAGIVVAVVLVAVVVVWVLIAGAGMFSPGPLNGQAKAQPLGGVASHAELGRDCGACHAAPWSTQTMADKCIGCHRDVGDQIAARSGLHGALVGKLPTTTCRGCHTDHHGPTGVLTVGRANFPHELTGYSLAGHQRTTQGAKFTCADCHPKGIAQFDMTACVDCHTTINASFMSQHLTQFGRDCLGCHNGTATKFDHKIFPLDHGSNEQKATCKTCHPNDFKTYTCFGCHRHTPANIQGGHEGQSLTAIANCIKCHPHGKQPDN